MKEKLKKVLITGVSGALGSRVVIDLLQNGFKVRALYRNKKSLDNFRRNIAYYTFSSEEIYSQIEWVEGDVTDYISILNAVEGIDIVCHCAALVSFRAEDFQLLKGINVGGTANIVDACLEKGVKKICHISSIAALGRDMEGYITDEKSLFIPGKKHSGYSNSKYLSEMEVWRGIHEGLECVILNPSVILSPGDWSSGNSGFYNSIYKGLRFYTHGSTGFVDGNDISWIIIKLLDNDIWDKCVNERFVLNSSNLTYKEFFSKVAASLNLKAPDIKVSKLVLGIFWRVSYLFGKISGKPPVITRETAETSLRLTAYDGSKITKRIGFNYKDIEDTITALGKMYLNSIAIKSKKQ